MKKLERNNIMSSLLVLKSLGEKFLKTIISKWQSQSLSATVPCKHTNGSSRGNYCILITAPIEYTDNKNSIGF